MQILIFHLGRQRYGIGLEDVRRILLAVAVTELPGGPDVVEGVVDVGGELLPVLNMRRRFGLPDREVAPEDHFVLGQAGKRSVLLHVDRAGDVATVDPSALEDARRAAPGVEHVAGVARVEDGLVVIHDLRGFLAAAEAAELDVAMDGLDDSVELGAAADAGGSAP